MFQAVASDTAAMIAHWLSVGFAHGVMNTDNMSVASVTIDFGPFGFVDEYDPNFIPNTSDDTGRYDLESQVGLTLTLAVPLSCRFCLGRWKLAVYLGKMVEHPKSKSTKPCL